MVYLTQTTNKQMLYIPKEGRDAESLIFLKVWSTINQFGFSLRATEENNSVLYHMVEIELKDNIPPGEYQYTLSDEQGELSTGLLIIGNLQSPMEYNKTIKYEQY